MVKKAKSRVLRLLMDGGSFSSEAEPSPPTAPGEIVIASTTPASGWEVFTTLNATQILVNRDYYDLQGYADEDLSFFPAQPQVQDQGWFYSSYNNTTIVDLITIKPVDDDDLNKMFPASPDASRPPPGSLGSLHDLQDIIYGRNRLFVPSIDIGSFSDLKQDNMWGLATATARDRIFITRIIYVQKDLSENQSMIVAPSAWVIAGVSAQEKDLVYVERLRRSYDHSAPG